MSGEEIKERIQQLNLIIEKETNPITFVLNKKVNLCIEEIEKLRKECPHCYENDICIYCQKRREK